MCDFNSYEDARRAEAYARLEFPGTYYLAYRDIPAIIGEHVTGDHVKTGNRALDTIPEKSRLRYDRYRYIE